MEEAYPSRASSSTPPDPVYVVDAEFTVRSMNPAAEALGVALQRSNVLPPEVLRVVRRPTLAPDRGDGAEGTGSEVVLSEPASGKLRTFVVEVLPLSPEPGHGWVVVLKDVTLLSEQNAARAKAMSTLGHEVRTPVSSIRMVLHLLLEEKVGPLTADQRELVAAGHEDCERLLTILQALLELARFESGRVALKRELISVDELLASSGMTAEPSSVASPRLMADSGHFVRALKIFGTAVLPGGDAQPAIARVDPVLSGRVRLVVRRGARRALSEAERARMLEPFAIKPENDPEKSGLSLAIAREIVSAHGGQVSVTSDEHGTEFVLDLPVGG